jgi:hypothetical protein
VSDSNLGVNDYSLLKEIERTVHSIESRLKVQEDVQEEQSLTLKKNSILLEKILAMLSPPIPVKFRIELTTQGDNMAKPKLAGINFRLLDNGTAAGTLVPQDSVGVTTTLPPGSSVPVYIASTAEVVLTPSADGLTLVVAPAVPPVAATGVTISVSATLPDGSVISGMSDPIDVVPGGPTGFKIQIA